MVEKKNHNNLKAALIACTVTLLLAIFAFVATFGALKQEVVNLCHDVEILLTVNREMQSQTSALCERVAALEAQIEVLRSYKLDGAT